MTPQVIIRLLSILTFSANIAVLASLLLFLLKKVKPLDSLWISLSKLLNKNGLFFAFIVSLTATLGSLYFSEIAHFEPCKLCWLQRIFMYPLPIILGTAIYKNLKEVENFVLPLSLIGGVIAIYHYYFQISGNPLIPCSTVGFSVSCSERFFTEFGYITIPFMSLTAFILITIGMLFAKASSKK